MKNSIRVALFALFALFASGANAEFGSRISIFADGYVKRANQELVIGVALNRAVEVEGEVLLKFMLAATMQERVAVYDPQRDGVLKDGSSVLSFVYKVRPGEEAKFLTLAQRPLDTTYGKVVLKTNRRPISLYLEEGQRLLPVTLDGVAPTVIGLDVEEVASGSENASILYKLGFDEDVVVTGVPYVPVTVVDGETERLDRAWYDRQNSSGQNHVFRLEDSQLRSNTRELKFGNAVTYDGKLGQMYDRAGNPVSGGMRFGDTKTTRYSLHKAPGEEVVQEAVTEEMVEKEEEETVEKTSDVSGWRFGVGVGVQGFTNIKDDSSGYRVSSRYQPMLEFSAGYDFLPSPREFSLALAVSARWAEFAKKVEYEEGSEKADLDSDDVASPGVLAKLHTRWSSQPTGLGVIGHLGQEHFVLLERNDGELEAVAVEVKTLAYGLGLDYRFDWPMRRFGVFGFVEGQQPSSSTDNNQVSKDIEMKPGFGFGVDWIGNKIPGETWYSAQLFYDYAAASNDSVDYLHTELGLKFMLNF